MRIFSILGARDESRPIGFLRRYNILPFTAMILILAGLSAHNYFSQKRVLLRQLQTDNTNLVHSFSAALSRFEEIREAVNLQVLVRNISLGLDIFEFRYLDRDGVIVNSMFEEEIGRRFDRPGFRDMLEKPDKLGGFYTDNRDMTPVLAITYPVYSEDELVGIIDLAVDISDLNYMDEELRKTALRHMQRDVRNLLKSISSSVTTSLDVYTTLDYHRFLRSFTDSSSSIQRISIVNQEGVVELSSDPLRAGNRVQIGDAPAGFKGEFAYENGQPVYRITFPLPGMEHGGHQHVLLMRVDAREYAENNSALLMTALATTLAGILFAVLIAYSIYRVNLESMTQERDRLEREVEARTEEIKRLSNTDPLTGLSSRRYLEEQMAVEFKRAVRYNHSLSLLMVDLDHFKKINDTLGHLAGDRVLSEVGRRLAKAVRETDFIGRYGGEEFVVILPETTASDATQLAEKMRELIAERPVFFEGRPIDVTASIGVAELTSSMTNYEEVFKGADRALYISKEGGRNRITCFNPARAKRPA
ncbi:MAG TPA: GGDEF domain-containing protein [Gammaproteobacteria bacterium]|nr:GGDEF domain-containing protein [Gammaproteobacteria bacterium]